MLFVWKLQSADETRKTPTVYRARGRRGEKVEDEVKHAGDAEEPVEKRGRGRPSSRGKGEHII